MMNEKRKKIAFVINYINNNGPSRVVLGIIRNLIQTEYSITLITLFSGNDPSITKELEEKNVVVHECKSLSRAGCILGKDRELKNIIDEEKYDIIHTHGMIPDIVSSHLSCQAKRVSTIHNNMFEDYLDSYGFIKSRFYILMHLKALRKLEQCICCSSSVYDIMKKRIDRISFIRNGIDLVKIKPPSSLRHSLGIPQDALLYLFAGSLNKGKNIVWLIKEFAAHHNEKEFLLVLGDGEKKEECIDCADDHIRILGFRKDVLNYMSISDVYISASRSEGFSIAAIEALSNGLGLLLSDIPSHREIIEIQKNIYLGELFSFCDFQEKKERIRSIPFDKKAISLFQEQELSAKRMAKEYMARYRSILE